PEASSAHFSLPLFRNRNTEMSAALSFRICLSVDDELDWVLNGYFLPMAILRGLIERNWVEAKENQGLKSVLLSLTLLKLADGLTELAAGDSHKDDPSAVLATEDKLAIHTKAPDHVLNLRRVKGEVDDGKVADVPGVECNLNKIGRAHV